MSSVKKKTSQKNTESKIKKYKESITQINKQNKELDSEIEDLKTTLKINQSICTNYIKNIFGEEDEELINMLKENENWLKENEKLIEKNADIENKIIILNDSVRKAPNEIQKELEKCENQNDKLQKEIIKKGNEIEKILFEKDKFFNKHANEGIREVFVIAPTHGNLELNNEIVTNRIIIKNVLKMSKAIKSKNQKLEKEISFLQYELKDNEISQKGKKYNSNSNNKIASMPLKNIKSKKYINEIKTTVIKKNESHDDSYNEQDCINFQSADNDSDENGQHENASESSQFDSSNEDENEDKTDKNGKKNKKKRLENLSNEYNKLKKQNEELENNIQKQKNIYLQLMSKIHKFPDNNKNNAKTCTCNTTEENTDNK